MKKIISISFVVLAIMAVFASTVFAAPAGKNATLVSVEYQKGGIVLLFQTSGLTKADFKNNSFYADSNNQNIYCNFVSDTTIVRCVVSKSLAGMGDFRGTLAGFGFSGELPQARTFDNATNVTLTCSNGDVLWYTIDWYSNGVFQFSSTIPAYIYDVAWQGATNINDIVVTGTFCAPKPPPMPMPF